MLFKHVGTVVYAVLIRQLVICPCLYEPVIAEACADRRTMSDQELARRARRLRRWKVRGDRIIVALLALHLLVIAGTISVMTANNHEGYSNRRVIYVNHILLSEGVNYFVWFVKFLPLFLLLFPIHRAQGFLGGSLSDYLLCRRHACAYASSDAYLDKTFPRRVEPETSKPAPRRAATKPPSRLRIVERACSWTHRRNFRATGYRAGARRRVRRRPLELPARRVGLLCALGAVHGDGRVAERLGAGVERLEPKHRL